MHKSVNWEKVSIDTYIRKNSNSHMIFNWINFYLTMSKTLLKSIYVQDHMSHIEIIGKKHDKYNLVHFFLFSIALRPKRNIYTKRKLSYKAARNGKNPSNPNL